MNIILYVYFVSLIVCILDYIGEIIEIIESIRCDIYKRRLSLENDKDEKDIEWDLIFEKQFGDLYPDYYWSYTHHPIVFYADILVRLFLSVVPVVNTIIMIIDVVPRLIAKFIDWFKEFEVYYD